MVVHVPALDPVITERGVLTYLLERFRCSGKYGRRRKDMKFSEFRKQLAALGAQFVEGTKHTKVYLNGKQTTLPRHGNQDMGEALRRAILRQLGVKRKEK